MDKLSESSDPPEGLDIKKIVRNHISNTEIYNKNK